MKINPFWQRIGAYLLQRGGEPSTWAGLVTVATALGVNWAPEKWQAISTIGAFIAGTLLAAAREGRNKPDNPSLPTTCKGEMPEPKPAIVPPSTDGMAPVSKGAQVVDAAGEVHAEVPSKPGG